MVPNIPNLAFPLAFPTLALDAVWTGGGRAIGPEETGWGRGGGGAWASWLDWTEDEVFRGGSADVTMGAGAGAGAGCVAGAGVGFCFDAFFSAFRRSFSSFSRLLSSSFFFLAAAFSASRFRVACRACSAR